MGRIVLVVEVAALRVEQLGERVPRHQPGPHVGGAAHRDRDRVARHRVGERRQGGVPDVEDIPGLVGIGEVGGLPRVHPHRVLPLGERARAHHAEELLAAPEFAVARRTQHVDLAAAAPDHGPEGGLPGLPDLAGEPGPVPELHRHRLPGERHRGAVEQDPVGGAGGHVEGVDRVLGRRVVGGGPAERPVEAADHREGPADPEIAVEVERSGHGDVGLVITRVPRQVGVPEQDRVARRGAARRQRPGVGALVGVGLGGLLARRGRGAARGEGAGDPRQETPRRGEPRAFDVAGGDVVAREIRRELRGKLLGVQPDIAVDPRREPLVDVAGGLVEPVVVRHGPGIQDAREKVGLDAVPAEDARHPAPGPEHPGGDHRAVVLELDPGQRVAHRLEVRGADVGNAVRGAQDLHPAGEVVRVRLCGERSAGEGAERDDAEPSDHRSLSVRRSQA